MMQFSGAQGAGAFSSEVNMKQRSFLRAAACALAGAALPALAQNSDALVDPATARQQAREIAAGDPPRWYRADTTRQDQWQTRRKEIGAALHEAKNACRKQPVAERGACLKEARATWERDLASARAELDAAPRP
jgi:hypothetical protein